VVYVPRGYVPLKKAVIEVAHKMQPDAQLSRYFEAFHLAKMAVRFDDLRISRQGFDPYCDTPSHEQLNAELRDVDVAQIDLVGCLRAIGSAKSYLRTILAENDLAAHGQALDGELSLIAPKYWRTDDGFWRLEIPDREDAYCQVFIGATEFSEWIARIPPDLINVLRSEPNNSSELMPDAVTHHQIVAWIRRRIEHDIRADKRSTKTIYRSEAFNEFAINPNQFDTAWKIATEIEPYKSMTKAGRPPIKKVAQKSSN